MMSATIKLYRFSAIAITVLFVISGCGADTSVSGETDSYMSENQQLQNEEPTETESQPQDQAGQAAFDDTSPQYNALTICAERLRRDPAELSSEIVSLIGRENFTVNTEAAGTDGPNVTWDHSSADVICTETVKQPGGLNLIQQLGSGQILYGSDSSEYIGEINGGIFFGGGGRDIAATIHSGVFYGGEGDDLVDSPLDHGFYNGWSFVPIVSNGIVDGTFVGNQGKDHVSAMMSGEFHGNDGDDSLYQLSGGSYYGGKGMDSVSDPYLGNIGQMSGGEFYGEADSDWADRVSGGSVIGGEGDDLIHSLHSAAFEGMSGDDTVYSLAANALFNGGTGDDTVDSMSNGIYDGGEGNDHLQVYADGTVINVESLPPCLQNSGINRSRCLTLPTED